MQIQDLGIAGLLHGIGKIGLSDELLRKPQEKMSPEESRLFMAHPVKGRMALMPITAFNEVGKVILHQYERYDGRGVPDGISGDQIALGARILAVARDYEALCSGAIATLPLPLDKALQIIKAQSGHRYDPVVVDSFIDLVHEKEAQRSDHLHEVKSRDLEVGMQLSEDLRTKEGVLLMMRETVMTEYTIQQIRKFEQVEQSTLKISVKLS